MTITMTDTVDLFSPTLQRQRIVQTGLLDLGVVDKRRHGCGVVARRTSVSESYAHHPSPSRSRRR